MSRPKRQTNRKVIVRFVGRDPKDPVDLLDAIESAFRPKDIEILVHGSDSALETTPDEQTETAVSAAVSRALDAKANRAESQPADEQQVRKGIRAWMLEKVLSGWRVVAAVAPVAEKLRKAFFD
ncbi:MAG: hypothetical protein HQ518_11345 [Rhodopirellula sp.]|nr:hypothetical protein [Rhodopirellula sp.]